MNSCAVAGMPDAADFSSGERASGTLRLRVASAYAVEAQHLEPVIIERINGFFGYRAVARIVLVQGLPVSAASVVPQPRPLSAAEQGSLDQRVEAVPEGELREALRGLGAAVIGSKRA